MTLDSIGHGAANARHEGHGKPLISLVFLKPRDAGEKPPGLRELRAGGIMLPGDDRDRDRALGKDGTACTVRQENHNKQPSEDNAPPVSITLAAIPVPCRLRPLFPPR
ncbi:hypothetical protein [Polaromonas sp. YR568]|uniref:hypothetical protein n=1 Tax=Polaromonas sp. YR568 TaxID=1855301 RepID=UPI00398BF9CF